LPRSLGSVLGVVAPVLQVHGDVAPAV